MNESKTTQLETLQVQLGLQSYIKAVSENYNISVKFDLELHQTPYTTEDAVHLHKDLSRIKYKKDLTLLRAHIAHQIAQIRYTDFSPASEIKDKFKKSLWETLIGTRADIKYLSEDFIGDAQALEEYEIRWLHTLMNSLKSVKDLSQLSKDDIITAMVYITCYEARSESLVLPNINKLKQSLLQETKGTLARRVYSYKSEIESITQINNQSLANHKALELVKRLISERDKEDEQEDNETNSKNGNQGEQQTTTDNTNNENNSEDKSSQTEQSESGVLNNILNKENLKNPENDLKVESQTGYKIALSNEHIIYKWDNNRCTKSGGAFVGDSFLRPGTLNSKIKRVSKDNYRVRVMEEFVFMQEDSKLLSRELIKLLQILSRKKKRFNKKKGKFHNKSLSRLLIKDASDEYKSKIFKKTDEAISLDTAVMILVDNSGSMSGERIRLATQAAVTLAETLDTIRIKSSIQYFSNILLSDIYLPYNAIIKDWNESIKTLRSTNNNELLARIATITNEMSSNDDSDSLVVAYRELQKQKAKRKILIVLSDGQPAGSDYNIDYHETTKAVVKELEQVCEVYGIGIQSNAVTKYYKNNRVLQKVEELPETLLSILKESFKKMRY